MEQNMFDESIKNLMKGLHLYKTEVVEMRSLKEHRHLLKF